LDFVEAEAWRPWTVDGCRRMGGYVTRYEGDFDFLTIRGAGHMVPGYKPKATFTFLKAWLEGMDYPVYDEKCEFPDAAEKAEVALPQ
jgi:carboxypeptidase C (cathepsin A)